MIDNHELLAHKISNARTYVMKAQAIIEDLNLMIDKLDNDFQGILNFCEMMTMKIKGRENGSRYSSDS